MKAPVCHLSWLHPTHPRGNIASSLFYVATTAPRGSQVGLCPAAHALLTALSGPCTPAPSTPLSGPPFQKTSFVTNVPRLLTLIHPATNPQLHPALQRGAAQKAVLRGARLVQLQLQLLSTPLDWLLTQVTPHHLPLYHPSTLQDLLTRTTSYLTTTLFLVVESPQWVESFPGCTPSTVASCPPTYPSCLLTQQGGASLCLTPSTHPPSPPTETSSSMVQPVPSQPQHH